MADLNEIAFENTNINCCMLCDTQILGPIINIVYWWFEKKDHVHKYTVEAYVCIRTIYNLNKLPGAHNVVLRG